MLNAIAEIIYRVYGEWAWLAFVQSAWIIETAITKPGELGDVVRLVFC